MLTVVLSSRDRASRLARTLDAFEALESPAGGHRLIVVDDGSRDGTPAMLEGRGERPSFRSVRSPPVGQNAARNRVLGEVEGDLVVFTDDDTIPRRDWLVRLREAADAHPEADVIAGTVVPRFEVVPPDWVLRSVRRGPSFAWVERPEEGWIDPTEAVGPAVAIRASHFAAGLRFDETIGPDGTDHYAMGSETEILLRLRARGAKAWYARSAVAEHVVTAEHVEERSLLRRAYRYGRGRCRLRTSRVARARLRLLGMPLALVFDLFAHGLRHRRATGRGDAPRALRSAWHVAYLAGHVDEIRAARGKALGLGRLLRLVPPDLRDVVAPRRTPSDATRRAPDADPGLVPDPDRRVGASPARGTGDGAR